MMFLNACYYDKSELLYGTGNIPCTDTAGAISYNQVVVPLLRQYCYNCHTGSFPSGSILMGTYASDKAIAQNGKLYGSITHSSGFVAMPQGMPKFSNCQLAIIRKWIDSGIPNN
jgi:hypothetical protein